MRAAFPARDGRRLARRRSTASTSACRWTTSRRTCSRTGAASAPPSALPQERLVVPGQVHGTTLAWVGEAEAGRGAFDSATVITEHDGLLTAAAGLGLVVSYADCVPVVIVADGDEGPALRRRCTPAGAACWPASSAWRRRSSSRRGRLRRRRRRPEHRPVLLRRGRRAAAPVRGPVPGLGRRRRPVDLWRCAALDLEAAGVPAGGHRRRRPVHGERRALLLAPPRPRG